MLNDKQNGIAVIANPTRPKKRKYRKYKKNTTAKVSLGSESQQ
jgi:hypothetical protein